MAGTAGGTVFDTAKFGLRSLAVGAVGDDEKADWVLMTLGKHGIDVSAMQRLKGIPTSATILNVRPNGERPALHVRGASDHFDVPPDMYDQVFDAPIVHLGGTGLLKKLDGPASMTGCGMRSTRASSVLCTTEWMSRPPFALLKPPPLSLPPDLARTRAFRLSTTRCAR